MAEDTKKQVRDIMSGFNMVRASSEQPWFQPHADVLFMLGHCFGTVRRSCQAKDWPQLFSVMQQVSGKSDEELMESVRLAHLAWVELLHWIDSPDNEGKDDLNWKAALDRVGWADVPIEGRIISTAQVGLYFLSRVWICGRQRALSRMTEKTTFQSVSEGVTQGFRSVDQDISPAINATTILRNAVYNAMLHGLKPENLEEVVKQAVAQFDPSKFEPNALNEVADDTFSGGN